MAAEGHGARRKKRDSGGRMLLSLRRRVERGRKKSRAPAGFGKGLEGPAAGGKRAIEAYKLGILGGRIAESNLGQARRNRV